MLASRSRPVLVTALNPSIDAEWIVPWVVWEEKNVLSGERRWPGGKGINVSRWLKHLGVPARLVLPLGGGSGRELALGLRQEGVAARVVRLADATRVNVIVTTAAQGQLRFNAPGPCLTAHHWRCLCDETRRGLKSAGCLVLSGSLPLGLPPDAYAQLIGMAHAAGVPALLDCEGEPLRLAVAARPFLVKPNEHELRAWRGSAWRGADACRTAARALSRVTGGWVLVSRGAAAAWLVHAKQGICLQALPPKVRPVNTVGAGDALLAAVAARIRAGDSPVNWLRHGLAAGSAAAVTPAGRLPGAARVRRLAATIRVASGAANEGAFKFASGRQSPSFRALSVRPSDSYCER